MFSRAIQWTPQLRLKWVCHHPKRGRLSSWRKAKQQTKKRDLHRHHVSVPVIFLYFYCDGLVFPHCRSVHTLVTVHSSLRVPLDTTYSSRAIPYTASNKWDFSFLIRKVITNQFGLWWHPAGNVSFMLLRRLRRLISSWSFQYIWSWERIFLPECNKDKIQKSTEYMSPWSTT